VYIGGFAARTSRTHRSAWPAATIEVPAGWDARLVKALDGTSFKERLLRAWSTGGTVSTDATITFQRLARLLNLESEAEASTSSKRSLSSPRPSVRAKA